MNAQDAAFAYQQSTARGASAMGQVVALYDGILRDFRRAAAAIECGDIQTRVERLNHALTIIAELQGVLDFERGGQPARVLESFYNVTRPMILDASITCNATKLQELFSLFTRIRNAWAEAEKQVETRESHDRPRISTPALVPAGPPSGETPASSRSGWSA